jgi:hypothetical protein
MKKIVASVGLIAVGVSGACAASSGFSSMDAGKSWGVSATLRGFYDDNYLCRASDEQESFGFDISPAIRYQLPLEQTYLGLGYIYSGRYYEDRSSDNPWDQSHQFDMVLKHAFNERYSLDFDDSFVIGQEPEVLAPSSGPYTEFYRTEGDNLRNQGRLLFSAQLTRVLGLQIGYNNVLWDYEQDGPGSRSAVLDRMEQMGLINLRWQALPETTAILGYNFGLVQYTGDEPIGIMYQPFPVYVMSDDRDLQSHYIYGGLNQNLLRNMSASIKLGATYMDYDNDDLNDDTWIPYVDVSASYTYATGSYVQLGYVNSFNSTDVVAPDSASGTITGAQETSTIYALWTHQISPKLAGTLHAHYQDSSFQGGLNDSSNDQFLMLGVNLTYMINRHVSCELGYNLSNLDSDIDNRGYDRNRVYIGVTASY